MQIALDVTELFGKPTGVGRYLLEVLTRWNADAGAGHRFLAYAPFPPSAVPSESRELLLGDGPTRFCSLPGKPGTWWQQTALCRAVNRAGPDVFFAPAYTCPLRLKVPVVLALHDVSFAAHPEWFGWREGVRLRWLARLSGRVAREVLTLSRFSRLEIAEHLGLPESRVLVIPPGVDRRFARIGDGPREPLVLYVGSLFNRRHIPEMIQAFARVASRYPKLQLAIVGDNRTVPHQDPLRLAQACGVPKQVTVERYVSDARLADLYCRASVFVFLSAYEGFGLTPLEALSAGVPSVLLDTPVAREVYGEAAVLVPPGDVEATAAAMDRLIHDADLRAHVLQHGAEVLSQYTWDRSARAIIEALERTGA